MLNNFLDQWQVAGPGENDKPNKEAKNRAPEINHHKRKNYLSDNWKRTVSIERRQKCAGPPHSPCFICSRRSRNRIDDKLTLLYAFPDGQRYYGCKTDRALQESRGGINKRTHWARRPWLSHSLCRVCCQEWRRNILKWSETGRSSLIASSSR